MRSSFFGFARGDASDQAATGLNFGSVIASVIG
jgi:hypothetical protein